MTQIITNNSGGGGGDLSGYQKKLVEGNGIDINQTTNEISVDTAVIATKQDLVTKQNVISDLDTIRNGAAKGATAVQPNDNISELNNDAGYIDKDVNDLTNYTKTSSLGAVALSNNYSDLSNKPDLSVYQTTANLVTNLTDPDDTHYPSAKAVSDAITASGGGDMLKSVYDPNNKSANAFDYNNFINTPTIPGVIDSLNSSSTTDALSANQGKVLKDAIDNLSGLGKFLSLWNSATGQPISFPLATPYTYTTGDWFMVEVVGTTDYKPTGSSYTGTASTTVESGTVKQGDVYIYDGTDWLLQVNNEPQVSFSEIAGQPTDNSNLSTALGNKQDKLVSGTNIKTVNSTSLLGSGNVAVQPTLVSGTNIKTVNSTSLLGSGNIAVQPTLVSGTNIRTINGTSILGSGDITTPVGGDVYGPASSTNGHLAVFDGATGKIIKDGGAVPTVPTKVSDLTNDSGYLTSSTGVTTVNGSHGAVTVNGFNPGGTATTGYVVTKTANGYEWAAPSGGIEVDSASPIQLTKIWAGTQAQYEALGSYDSTTVYLTI